MFSSFANDVFLDKILVLFTIMHEKQSIECAYHRFLYDRVDLGLAYSLGIVISAELKPRQQLIPRYLLRHTNMESRAAVYTGAYYPRVATQIVSETRALEVSIRMLYDDGQWEQKLFP